jgi:steroid delta-isomerase-like uncharacterized protein
MSPNRALLERYVELYNQGDLDACMELYADDAVQRWPDGLFHGRDAIRARLAQDLQGVPDATYIVRSFLEAGDLFADEWTVVGTQTGVLPMPDGNEVPPTGRHHEINGMEFVEVRDGKIVVDNLYYDMLSIGVQLGLAPQGAAA